MKFKPHKYQEYVIDHILKTPQCGIFAEMGLGKSIMTLSALEFLLNTFELKKVLIIAPKRVASSTWPNELKKWDHLHFLTVSVLKGTEKQRIAALNKKADIYTISRDLISWLVHYQGKLKRWPFDALVIDELSSFKNPSAIRFKAVRKILPHCDRVIGLTGTPTPKSLLDLWSQLFLLDGGQRLEHTYGAYKDKYFIAGARNGNIVFSYYPKKDAEQQIFDKISDICLSLKNKDYLDLPSRIDIFEEIELESNARYQQFKKTEILTLADGNDLTPVSAAVMYSKLLQYCNGAVYKDDGSYEVVDGSKLEVLQEEIESLCGAPVLVGYHFKSDYERIIKVIPDAVKLSTDEQLDQFNAGEIAVGLAQIQSISHGVNLQDNCTHVIMYGVGWNLEVHQQFLSRVHRQNVKGTVIVKYLVAKDSIEQLVIERLNCKEITQESLMSALKRYL